MCLLNMIGKHLLLFLIALENCKLAAAYHISVDTQPTIKYNGHTVSTFIPTFVWPLALSLQSFGLAFSASFCSHFFSKHRNFSLSSLSPLLSYSVALLICLCLCLRPCPWLCLSLDLLLYSSILIISATKGQ